MKRQPSLGFVLKTLLSWHPGLHPLPLKKEAVSQASLVVPWLASCLAMQRTAVRSLVRQDPACSGATEPVSHRLDNKKHHRSEKPACCN